MESRGAVNRYTPYLTGRRLPGLSAIAAAGPGSVFVINLADGTTPFMHLFGGREYASDCYNLTGVRAVTVTHGHYRPTKAEFDTLDKDTQDHVLNGGLLCEPLTLALQRQLPADMTRKDAEYEAFQVWCLSHYGRRLEPLPGVEVKRG